MRERDGGEVDGGGPAGGGEHDERRGDAEAAVHALYVAHYIDLVRLARVLVDDPGAAEEVVQEAFAAVWQHWARVRNQDDALAYVRRSVVNLSRSRLRRRRTRRRFLAGQTEGAIDAHRSAEASAMANGASADLRAALTVLPRRQRECVVLRHLGGCSITETATLLGISPGAVKAHTHRGLHTLADVLQEVR